MSWFRIWRKILLFTWWCGEIVNNIVSWHFYNAPHDCRNCSIWRNWSTFGDIVISWKSRRYYFSDNKRLSCSPVLFINCHHWSGIIFMFIFSSWFPNVIIVNGKLQLSPWPDGLILFQLLNAETLMVNLTHPLNVALELIFICYQLLVTDNSWTYSSWKKKSILQIILRVIFFRPPMNEFMVCVEHWK